MLIVYYLDPIRHLMGANFVFLEKVEGLMILRNMEIPYLVMIILSQASYGHISEG